MTLNLNQAQIKIYRSLEQIRSLEPLWQNLSERCAGRCFFQSPAWCLHVLNSTALLDGATTVEPVVATAFQGTDLVAVWPLSLRREGGLRIITSLADPFDQYTDMLCDPDANSSEVLVAMVDSLRDAFTADGMVLRKVRSTSVVQGLALIGASVVDEGNQAPQIEFGKGQSFAEFLSGVKAKTRKNLRNYKNRLEREGRLQHKVLQGSQIAVALRESFTARREWLAVTGQSSAGFRNKNFERVVSKLADNDSENLGLVAFALTLNDQMIAIQWGFIHQGCYHAYMSSKDPEFEKYSVGRIHLKLILEECHKLAVSSVDLMVPSVPYKQTWATATDEVVDLVWPWSIRARFKMGIIDQRVRPWVKKLFSRLPLAIQRKLSARMNAGSSGFD